MLRSQLEDNVKAWDLEPDGQYVKRAPHKAPRLNSQEEMMEWAVRTEGRGVALPGGGGQGIQNFLVSILERIRPAD
ncbi:hypothetical protein SDC9_65845 [bioreactor metagenome]|uniref:Uncharacterized protein n=1 Tax=bioreactor metagenome TaxID=1076179 RepID=A0A644XUJ4_9ZZZZ